MYLKNIEVQGFKSFMHKMNFEFHNGITCIVGPNGSGKSNVADAVRWVLGEQSAKQLRGGNMQDVIFAGTETRKPQSYAYVSITLDNSDHKLDVDYDEVTVTRRLYRSGESEYILNGTNVRLRDIHELFYDTGIGKEGYSIIGQGRIDQIISGKQDDKRELFDEAAGIVKFKRRKMTALKKLDNERQNLIRVKDILSELSGRVGPLKAQAEKAKEYLKNRDRLKDLDINLYIRDREQVDEKLADIDSKYTIASDGLAEAKDTLEKTKAEYIAVEKELETIEEKINHIHRQDEANTLHIEQLNGHLQVLLEQVNSLESSSETNESRVQTLTAELESRLAQIRENEDKKAGISEKLAEAESEKRRAEESLAQLDDDLAKAEEESEQAKSDIISLLNQRAQVKSRLQRYDTLREQVDIRQAEIIQRELALKEDEDAVKEALDEAEEKLRKVKEETEAATVRISQLDGIIEKLRDECDAKEDELEKVRENYHRNASRLESLKGITERYEGYSYAVQRVMSLRKENSGIKGVVADIINADKKYETAIETALGGNIRNIVTDTQKTARNLIEQLKREKAGRVTFLPLNGLTVTGKNIPKELLSENGVIGLASELVTTEKEYEILPEYLLGKVVVIEDIDSAILLSNKYGHKNHLVTLSGEYLSPGGSMTGGAFKSKGNLLGRRREIEELGAEVEKQKEKIDALVKETEALNEKRNAQSEKRSTENEALHRSYIDQNTLEVEIRQIREKSDGLKLDREAIDREKRQLASQISSISSGSKDVNDELSVSESREYELKRRAEELDETIEALSEERARRSGSGERVRIALSGLNQQMAFVLETIERLKKEGSAIKASIDEIGEGDDRNRTVLETKLDEIEDTRKKIASAEKFGAESRDSEAFLLEKKDEMKESNRGFFEKRDALSEQITELDKECFRIQTQRERINESLANQEAELWDKYEITPSEAMKLKDEELSDYQSLKKEAGEAKKKIRSLGDVNVSAIGEYEEVSERYEFLSSQHEDLVKSEESLLKIIGELDRSMREQFNERFSAINEEFDKAFKELFGGGTGSVRLEEGADVLDADISIVSQPPGKKLQNIMQLSGGEKSLTAIALLFAIQNLKPSPFCLLDEIEAALDDANVVRFTRYLHKLTDNTQFIIITHRKGTMATADRLYGITMQEKGVSALVSVNLVEEELDN